MTETRIWDGIVEIGFRKFLATSRQSRVFFSAETGFFSVTPSEARLVSVRKNCLADTFPSENLVISVRAVMFLFIYVHQVKNHEKIDEFDVVFKFIRMRRA